MLNNFKAYIYGRPHFRNARNKEILWNYCYKNQKSIFELSRNYHGLWDTLYVNFRLLSSENYTPQYIFNIILYKDFK